MLYNIAIILLIVGGLNWGLVGLFNFDLVAAIFGPMSLISKVVYILVGVSAVIVALKKLSKKWRPPRLKVWVFRFQGCAIPFVGEVVFCHHQNRGFLQPDEIKRSFILFVRNLIFLCHNCRSHLTPHLTPIISFISPLISPQMWCSFTPKLSKSTSWVILIRFRII